MMKKFLVLAFILGAMSLNAQVDVVRKCYPFGTEQIWNDAIDPEAVWVKENYECTLVKASKADLDTAKKLVTKNKKRYTQTERMNEIAFNVFRKQYDAAKTDEEKRKVTVQYEKVAIQRDDAKNILNISRNRLGYAYLSIPGSLRCRFFQIGNKIAGIGYSACVKRDPRTKIITTNIIPSMAACVDVAEEPAAARAAAKGAIGFYYDPYDKRPKHLRKKCYIHKR